MGTISLQWEVKLKTWLTRSVLIIVAFGHQNDLVQAQSSSQATFAIRERLTDGIFTGQIRNGLPHGRGTIQYRDNDASGRFNYTGDFVLGALSGTGTMVWRNGASYTGTIRNNLMEGEGVYSWPNGDRYVGQYSNGRRNGIGEMEYGDGDAYRGSWRDGKYHGQGRYEWANGNVYQGDWEDGVAMGHGEFEYGSGSRQGERYSGAFNRGVKHGYGTYYYPNGQSFVGEYRNGLRNGPGTLYFDTDGNRKRDGFWIDGILQDDESTPNRLNGQALSTDVSTFISSASFNTNRQRPTTTTTETNNDGSFLTVPNFSLVANVDDEGDEDFVQNLPNQVVTDDQLDSPVASSNGDQATLNLERGTYVGQVRNGVPHGLGTLTYSDSVRTRSNYTGSWVNGMKNGRGTMVWRSGDRYSGDWLNDLPHGQGNYDWAEGHRYNGDYRQGQPDGFGLFQSAQGDIYQGQFQAGLPHGQGEYFYGGGEKRLDKYTGEFDQGAFHGRGKYFFANGDRYEGDFANGERSGQGIMFYNTGGYRQGTWRNDRLVGRVTYNKPDGTVVTEVWQEPRNEDDSDLQPDRDPTGSIPTLDLGMSARNQAKALFRVLVSAGTFDSLLGSEESTNSNQVQARLVQNDNEGSLRSIRQLF